jgi:hypothetical protein
VQWVFGAWHTKKRFAKEKKSLTQLLNFVVTQPAGGVEQTSK